MKYNADVKFFYEAQNNKIMPLFGFFEALCDFCINSLLCANCVMIDGVHYERVVKEYIRIIVTLRKTSWEENTLSRWGL